MADCSKAFRDLHQVHPYFLKEFILVYFMKIKLYNYIIKLYFMKIKLQKKKNELYLKGFKDVCPLHFNKKLRG